MTTTISSGDHALQRLKQLSHRLHHLRADVLADRDPEPLHQYRISLRRLRSLLVHLGPALDLPDRVTPRRVALLARATGQTRDLDVLRQRLEQDLLPDLSPEMRQQCGASLRERLAHRRHRAFALLEAELLAPRTQRLLSRLHEWQQHPRYTLLGEQPLRPWFREWLLSLTGFCFLQAGWFAQQPDATELHDLRKHLKAVRYGLELLKEHIGPPGETWLQRLRQAQGCLGDLQDLAVLQQLLLKEMHPRRGDAGETLLALLARDRHHAWERWLQCREDLLDPASRASLLTLDWVES